MKYKFEYYFFKTVSVISGLIADVLLIFAMPFMIFSELEDLCKDKMYKYKY